jgi:hypothetical protein
MTIDWLFETTGYGSKNARKKNTKRYNNSQNNKESPKLEYIIGIFNRITSKIIPILIL